jgi:hypothetical protein
MDGGHQAGLKVLGDVCCFFFVLFPIPDWFDWLRTPDPRGLGRKHPSKFHGLLRTQLIKEVIYSFFRLINLCISLRCLVDFLDGWLNMKKVDLNPPNHPLKRNLNNSFTKQRGRDKRMIFANAFSSSSIYLFIYFWKKGSLQFKRERERKRESIFSNTHQPHHPHKNRQ